MLKKKQKLAKWRQQRTKDGKKWIIEPAPVLKNLNFDLFERGCLLLGIDPDDLMNGNFEAEKLPEPSLQNAQSFIDLVLTNPELYRLKEWELNFVRVFVGIVASNFIVSSLVSSGRPRSMFETFRSVTVSRFFPRRKTVVSSFG